MRRRPPDPPRPPARPGEGAPGEYFGGPRGSWLPLRPELAATGPPARPLASGKGMGEGLPDPFGGGGSRATAPLLGVWSWGVSQPPTVSFLLGEVCPALRGKVP